ncbi:MAG: disulfide bond formation protein B [Hyphomicrobiaceae bacterium]|nr:disulfide bond formation protein B [Hyphomicrobiaceae bacterium]
MDRDAYNYGGTLLFAAFAIIGVALAFEHVGGYAPCPLCLVQRYAYYATLPLAFLALVLVSAQNAKPAALIFLFLSLAFLANSGLGFYQSGAEWGWWPGPQSCAAGQAMSGTADSMLADLAGTTIVRCDEAAWRDPVLGLSFAGWNVVASFALFVVGLKAAFAAADRN